MQANTAIREAFERAGLDARDVELNVALARYRNRGGSKERAIELVATAYELPDGAKNGVSQDRSAIASIRQPNGDEGQPPNAVKADVGMPASPANRDGVGQPAFAKGQLTNARSAREPTAIEREAAKSVARTIALTVLDTMKVRDGRPWRVVRYADLRSLEDSGLMEGYLARLLRRHGTPQDENIEIGDFVNVETFQRFKQQAAELADAV